MPEELCTKTFNDQSILMSYIGPSLRFQVGPGLTASLEAFRNSGHFTSRESNLRNPSIYESQNSGSN